MKVADKTVRLLIVDDEPKMRQRLVDLVRLKGYHADVADSERTAIGESETSIVTAMIQIAKGLKLIAEGVETGYQLAFLRSNHCDECQGYLFSRPVNIAEATRTLIASRSLNPAVQLVAVN